MQQSACYFDAQKCLTSPLTPTDLGTRYNSGTAVHQHLGHVAAGIIYYTTTILLQLSRLCPWQPGWASTRRKIHPFTPIVVIDHSLCASSFMIHGILLVEFTCLTVFFHSLCLTFLWSTSWPGTLHFMLHTFLHQSFFFFCSICPYHRNLFLL